MCKNTHLTKEKCVNYHKIQRKNVRSAKKLLNCNSYIKILGWIRNFVKVTSALSYESIHRIQIPKPFQNGSRVRDCPKSRQTLLDFLLDAHLAVSARTFTPQIGEFQESFSTFHCPERKFRTFWTAS